MNSTLTTCLVLLAAWILSDPPVTSRASCAYRMQPVPVVQLDVDTRLSTSEVRRIKQLIASLANVSEPMIGASPTMSGTAFFPLPDTNRPNAMLLTDHGLQRPAAVCELVTLGPRALPFLLDALSDRTPTKISIGGIGMGGGMWFERELPINLANPIEARALACAPPFEADLDNAVENFTVKVGDLAFVAIGQITGRAYTAVRYQPSGCVVLNSPTQNKDLAHMVRSIWFAAAPRRQLLDSLLRDFSLRDTFEQDEDAYWFDASELQSNAALRMLYYFPEATSRLIVDRIRGLDVRRPHEPNPDDPIGQWLRREQANGIRSSFLIKAVSWSRDKDVRSALEHVFLTSDDVEVVLAALPALLPGDEGKNCRRLGELLRDLPPDETAPYGDGYDLLEALGRHGGADARTLYAQFLKGRPPGRTRTMCLVLRKVRSEWALDFLPELLLDKRKTNYEYSPDPRDPERRLRIRICDEAAQTLSEALGLKPFELEGSHEELDDRINDLMKEIGRHLQRKG